MSQIKEVAIITGASRGIGEAIAKRLASEGMITALFGRDVSKLDSVKNSIIKSGGEAISFTGDVTDKEFVHNSVNDILNEFGKIDHLINNAGLAILKKFVDSDLDEFKQQMEVNVYGIYNFTKAVISGMIENKNGSVINISSLAGKNGFVHGSMYSATKHAVMGFSKSLMMEVRDYNIRVAAVCPGSVATEMIANTPIQPKDNLKVLQPEDVAEVVSTVIKLPVRALVSEIEIRPTNPK